MKSCINQYFKLKKNWHECYKFIVKKFNYRASLAHIFLCIVVSLMLLPKAAAQTPLAAGSHEITLTTSDGLSRKYLIYIPSGVAQTTAAPVLLNLHGGGGSAAGAVFSTRLNETADSEGFIAVYPEGIPAPAGTPATPYATWNAGICCGEAAAVNVDDVGFIDAVLDDLELRTLVDQSRIYISGLSNGAIMAHRIACETPERFAAMVSVAAPSTLIPGSCIPQRRIPTLMVHGVADPCVSCEGGSDACGGCFQEYFNTLFGTNIPPITLDCESVNDFAMDLSSSSNCNSTFMDTQPFETVSCRQWNECDGDGVVKLCNAELLGHYWPSGNTIEICETFPNSNACLLWLQTFGPQDNTIDNSFLWGFLSSHQLKNSAEIPTLPLLGSFALAGLIALTIWIRKNKL